MHVSESCWSAVVLVTLSSRRHGQPQAGHGERALEEGRRVGGHGTTSGAEQGRLKGPLRRKYIKSAFSLAKAGGGGCRRSFAMVDT